jgi:aspartyl-tRNA(Asn)/glutamyl-tRNA(Gln) amidotransferase subunit C
MSSVSREDINHLATLARLSLTEEEEERYASQLSNVVGYVEQLQKVAVTEKNIGKGVTGLSTVLAADVPRSESDPAFINTEALLTEAPLRSEHFVQVRAVLNGEGGAA